MTPEQEIAWERAKDRAHEEFPDATGDRFYRIVMTTYKKMARYQPHSSIVTSEPLLRGECDDESSDSKFESSRFAIGQGASCSAQANI